MNRQFAFAILLFMLSCSIVAGQTAKDLEAKYGKPENVYPPSGKLFYSMGEHIWMTPAYSADGRVCLMQIYPRSIPPAANETGDGLVMDEVLKIINELIPLSTRGARKDLFGISDLGGGIARTHFDYDRVEFTFISFFRVEKLPPPQTIKALPPLIDEKSLAEARQKEAMRPDDELIRERAFNSKALAIRWVGRKCAGS